MIRPERVIPDLPPGARVLVVRLRSLGDMVLLTPSLTALKEHRPDLRLSVVAEPASAPVLEGHPAVEEVIVHRRFAPTVFLLRRRRWDLAYNQHGGPTSALLTALSGAKVTVGRRSGQFSSLFSIRVPPAEEVMGRGDLHTVEERVALLRHTGLPPGPIPPSSIRVPAAAAAQVRERLAAMGVGPGEPYALVHPAANYETKVWDPRDFARAARWLREARGIRSVVVLGPADRRLEPEVRRHLGAEAPLIQDLDLHRLAALAAGARVFLGCDSGPAHLAAAAGTPAVVVFGSSSDVAWRPWGVPGRAVHLDLPCRPCPGSSCALSRPACILDLPYAMVEEALAGLLDETAGPGEGRVSR